MEKFLALPKEKQDTIVEAGYACFAQMGYKKASVADIAAKAGISKAMIFHYFGSKKNMYFFLMERASEEFEQILSEYGIPKEADCFDRLMAENKCKCLMLKKHPAIIAFLLSIFAEEDEEVKAKQKELFWQRKNSLEVQGIDPKECLRFKEGVNPRLVIHLVTNYVENIARKAALGQISDMDSVWEDVSACFAMLEKHLLKEI